MTSHTIEMEGGGEVARITIFHVKIVLYML